MFLNLLQQQSVAVVDGFIVSIVFVREAVQLEIYLIQIDPKSCPRQSILAIMTKFYIFSQPRTFKRLNLLN